MSGFQYSDSSGKTSSVLLDLSSYYLCGLYSSMCRQGGISTWPQIESCKLESNRKYQDSVFSDLFSAERTCAGVRLLAQVPEMKAFYPSDLGRVTEPLPV